MKREEIPSQIAELKDYVITLRRKLHQHPETAFKEYETAKTIEAELASFGIPSYRVGETGVAAILKGNGDGKVILLRADIDALPITEENDVPYRSLNNGCMHACGHDVHTAVLLAAAKYLSTIRDEFSGEVRFVFQPAEEIGQGAKTFLGNDILKNVDRCFGLHTAPDLPAGSVGIRKGMNNASVDHFTIKVEGKAAHVSEPQKGTDAAYIISQIVVALQPLVSRLSSPLEPLVVGVGRISAGTTYNIVADRAEAEGTVRALTHETRKITRNRITAIAEETAHFYGGSATVELEDFASPLINNSEVCDELIRTAEYIPDVKVVTDRPLSLTGDDMAEFLLEIPGAYMYLGTSNKDKKNTSNPYHTPLFDIDEDVMLTGIAFHVLYSLSVLGAI